MDMNSDQWDHLQQDKRYSEDMSRNVKSETEIIEIGDDDEQTDVKQECRQNNNDSSAENEKLWKVVEELKANLAETQEQLKQVLFEKDQLCNKATSQNVVKSEIETIEIDDDDEQAEVKQEPGKTKQMRTHAGDRRFKCKKCNYVANWRSNLIVHKRIHSGERPYKCKFCKYAAAQRCHLITHIRTHTGEKPYKCQICKFAAAKSNNLIRHNRIHTGEKPYKCRFCKYAAAQRVNLNQHMRTHHKHALKLCAANSKKTSNASCSRNPK